MRCDFPLAGAKLELPKPFRLDRSLRGRNKKFARIFVLVALARNKTPVPLRFGFICESDDTFDFYHMG